MTVDWWLLWIMLLAAFFAGLVLGAAAHDDDRDSIKTEDWEHG